jgi:hypothetical protein
MTEPVAAMTSHRAPDPEVRGLPMPRAPTDKHLTKSPSRIGVVVPIWIGIALSFGAFSMGSLLGGIAGVVITVASIALAVRRGRRFSASNAEAIVMLNAGELDAARASFETLAKGAPSDLFHAIAVYNCAATSLRTTDIERTLSLYAAVWRSKALAKRGYALHRDIPFRLAVLYAQVGDTTAADAWLTEGKKAKPSPLPSSMDKLAEAWVFARRGNFQNAATTLEQKWRAIEATTQADMTRYYRLFRAFVAHRAGQTQQNVEELLAGCRPCSANEYNGLTRGWPDLRQFVVDRGFASPDI